MLQHTKPLEEKKKGGWFSSMMKKVDGCDIELKFKGKKGAEDMVDVDDPYEYTSQKMHMFLSDESVAGVLELRPRSKISHQGISITLSGVITANTDKEEKTEFCRQEKKFQADGGTLSINTPLEFDFNAPKEYESYRGLNAKVQYFLILKVKRSMMDINFKEEIWVSKLDPQYQTLRDRTEDKQYFREKDFSKGCGMEVGVDDLLHIDFKYDKKIFHTKERIVGQVGFKVAKLDLHYGEVGLVRREYIGMGTNQFFESETLQKFEIMDGLPVPGEVVPIRLYLASIPRLTPSYPNVNNIFMVKYFVNLVLVTGDGKRYFKQQEITIYRRKGQEAPTPMVIDVSKAGEATGRRKAGS
eukprot:TRINITY_DN8947_c0_g1_i1.p1 TRINITY_DN8947_c0_g1~~TRINITY_DN8947_c0_g1_i1.p1  ORF type:complete len:384 (+),score=185.45 TRINITY_DN8947_c0_g1_i1:85-1152(+)